MRDIELDRVMPSGLDLVVNKRFRGLKLVRERRHGISPGTVFQSYCSPRLLALYHFVDSRHSAVQPPLEVLRQTSREEAFQPRNLIQRED
jgi:hypothetical protein